MHHDGGVVVQLTGSRTWINRSRHGCVTTLHELFTPMRFNQQPVCSLYLSVGGDFLCAWEGNRSSSIALAMRCRIQRFTDLHVLKAYIR